jgi:hypothetical protein
MSGMKSSALRVVIFQKLSEGCLPQGRPWGPPREAWS